MATQTLFPQWEIDDYLDLYYDAGLKVPCFFVEEKYDGKFDDFIKRFLMSNMRLVLSSGMLGKLVQVDYYLTWEEWWSVDCLSTGQQVLENIHNKACGDKNIKKAGLGASLILSELEEKAAEKR